MNVVTEIPESVTALLLLVATREIRNYLRLTDPKALAQCVAALGEQGKDLVETYEKAGEPFATPSTPAALLALQARVEADMHNRTHSLVSVAPDQREPMQDCPECFGRGMVFDFMCQACDGSGLEDT